MEILRLKLTVTTFLSVLIMRKWSKPFTQDIVTFGL